MTKTTPTNSRRSTRPREPLGLSVLHRFFLFGGVAGFLGTTWLGVHLWLMLNGKMAIPNNYHDLRTIHATVQLYGFLGLFIAGFLLQAAPRLLKLKSAKTSAYPLAPSVAALLVLTVAPQSIWVSVLLAMSWLLISIFVGRLLFKASRENFLSAGVLILLGSCTFLLGSFLDHGQPLDALFILWCGVFPIIFAAGQFFIAAFLGGKRLNEFESVVFLSLLLASVVSLACFRFLSSEQYVWSLFATTSTASLLYFVWSTGVFKSCFKRSLDPVGFSFSAFIVWSIIGAISLFRGASFSDYSLHIWATGAAVTLIMGLSSRLVGFLSGNKYFTEGKFVIVLLIWQLVPLGRGGVLAFPAWFSFVVGAAAGVSVSIWIALVLTRFIGLIRRSLV